MASSRPSTEASQRPYGPQRPPTEIFGVGPIIACMAIGHIRDLRRFRDCDHYAAYNGTAPTEFSSGGRVVHRLSLMGNRQLNHAIHMAPVCRIRQSHSTAELTSNAK